MTRGRERATMSTPRRSDLRYQLLVGISFLVGLFFIEYLPIFLLGYWSWGASTHKILTGLLIVLNLLIAQYATKRLGFFSDVRKADGGQVQERAAKT
jgi:hypothetical protein